MAGFVKLEQRRAVEWEDGQVLKTAFVKFQWFKIEEQPELYKLDSENRQWCPTTDYHFGLGFQ